MLDEGTVPAGDPEQATYFERLRKSDCKAFLNEELALRQNYGIYRMNKDSLKRLKKQFKEQRKQGSVLTQKRIKKIWDDASYDPLCNEQMANKYLYISYRFDKRHECIPSRSCKQEL